MRPKIDISNKLFNNVLMDKTEFLYGYKPK